MSVSIALDIQEKLCTVGEWIQLTPTVDIPKDVSWDINDKNLIWKTTNPNVAVVDDKGLVNTIGKGVARITVALHYDKFGLNGWGNGVASKYAAVCVLIVK